MKKTIIALATAGLGLAGCGGDNQTVNKPAATPELYFAYPADTPVMADGQQLFTTAVPVSAPIFLRFTDRITTPVDEISGALTLADDQGNIVPLGTAILTSGDEGLAIKPLKNLSPRRTYTLTANDLEVAGQAVSLTSDGIVFKTEPATSGPLLSQTEGVDFRVARFIPLDDDRYPATDLSVLRVQFTEPVKASTVIYGETFSLRDGSGELVPAEVYLRGHRLTIDPDDYLDPSQTYSVEVTDDIESEILGAKLTVPAETPWTFQPMDTRSPNGERLFAAQKAAETNGEVAISGAEFNTVNLQSKLLGEKNPTTAGGVVFAELGYIPRFERAGKSVPLAIRRGSLMTGSSVTVKVAGAVPAGFETDNISVHFISDANGFLSPNPYTDADDAPRLVELYIDMALNTQNPVANAALTQQIMHVQLVGTAIVEDGSLTIEAVGVIEPGVMGVDTASGLISFRLEGFRFEKDAPTPEQFADQEAPFVKSWLPGEDNQKKLRPGEPITIFFSEPMLPSSISHENILLTRNDKPNESEGLSLSLNGSALTINPTTPLDHGAIYTLDLGAGLSDLSGNTMTPVSRSFSLAPTLPGTSETQAPLLLTTFPGFPCPKVETDIPSHQGRCAGGKLSGDDVPDDILPIAELHGTQPISVRFSQSMDLESLVAGDTVLLEKFEEQVWAEIPVQEYYLEKNLRELKIIPLTDWADDTLYRYTLNAKNPILSAAQLPLQSLPISQNKRSLNDQSKGGSAVINYFRGSVITSTTVPLPLRNLPTADANSDLIYQESVEAGSTAGEILDNSIGLEAEGVRPVNADTLVNAANVGCRVGENCAKDKLIYLTAMLDTEVSQAATADGRVPVEVYPSIIATTSSSVWVNIDTEVIDSLADLGLANTGIQAHEEIPTGPMFLRIRYTDDTEGNQSPLMGEIFTDENGQISFELNLDVYLDAPYLDPTIGPAELDHNLRSYQLSDITVKGPITFLEDGRMQINLANQNPISIDVEVNGRIDINSQNTSGICAIPLFSDLCNIIANDFLRLDASTVIQLTIPEGSLKLTYLSPNTQL